MTSIIITCGGSNDRVGMQVSVCGIHWAMANKRHAGEYREHENNK